MCRGLGRRRTHASCLQTMFERASEVWRASRRETKRSEAEAFDHRSERPWLRAAPPAFPTHSLLRRGGRMEYHLRSSGHESVARADQK